jgi:hypothetical protein
LATCSAAVLKNLDAWLANREIRRRTRVVGAFPDGQSALNLAAARLRHIAGTRWSTRRYLDMITPRGPADRLTNQPPPQSAKDPGRYLVASLGGSRVVSRGAAAMLVIGAAPSARTRDAAIGRSQCVPTRAR